MTYRQSLAPPKNRRAAEANDEIVMDRISFKLAPLKSDKRNSQFGADIFINDENLIEKIRIFEKPFAEKEGHPSLAGEYEGMQPEWRLKEISESGERQYIFACNGCGEPGCWPIMIDIVMNGKEVVWKNFRQPHRGSQSKSSFWDYSQIPRVSF